MKPQPSPFPLLIFLRTQGANYAKIIASAKIVIVNGEFSIFTPHSPRYARGMIKCLTFLSTDDEDASEETSSEPTLIVDDKDDMDGEDDDEQDPWTITDAPQTSDRYGECLMPVTPALDPDLSPQSGMRFGKTSG